MPRNRTPAQKARAAVYAKEYNRRPEVRERMKDRSKRPEIIEYQRRYRLRPETRAAFKDANKRRETVRRQQQGIVDAHRFYEVFEAQGQVCGCCGATEETRGGTGWHADHDHATGMLRGVLCQRCNMGIGLLGDDATGVARALRYLQQYCSVVEAAE